MDAHSFDHGTPRGLIRALGEHRVVTAYAQGWEKLKNGDLLKAAEEQGFELLLTTDRRIQYQQNLKNRKIAIVVLSGTIRWSQVRLHFSRIQSAVNAATVGSYAEVNIPFRQA